MIVDCCTAENMAEANGVPSIKAITTAGTECNGKTYLDKDNIPPDELKLCVDYLSDSHVQKLSVNLHELLGPYIDSGAIPDLVLLNREYLISTKSFDKKQITVPVNYESHPHILKLTEGVVLSGKYSNPKLTLRFGYEKLQKEDAVRVIQREPNLDFIDFLTTLLKDINMFGKLSGLYNLNIEAARTKKGAMETVWKKIKSSKDSVDLATSFNSWKCLTTLPIQDDLPKSLIKSSTCRVFQHLKVAASDPFRNPKELMDAISFIVDYYTGSTELKDFIITLYGIASAHLTYKGIEEEEYVYEAKIIQLLKFHYTDNITKMETKYEYIKKWGQDSNYVKIDYRLILSPTKTRSVGLDLITLIDSSVASETILEELKEIFVLDKVEMRRDHIIFH